MKRLVLGLLAVFSVWACHKEPVVEPEPDSEKPPVYTVSSTDLDTSRDGMKIHGVLYTPDGYRGKMPAVIFCTGLNASYEETFPYAEAVASMGFAGYCFDFCGGRWMSTSDGETEDMSILTEVQDLDAVYRTLSARSDIDPSRMYLTGGSQGGLVAALYAAEYPSRFKALGLMFPAFNIPTLVKTAVDLFYGSLANVPETVYLMGYTFGRTYVVDAYRLRPYETIGQYGGDVLILHGDDDSVVPLSYSERALQVYEHAELKVLPEQGHGFTGTGLDTAIGYLREFLWAHRR